MDVYVDKNSFLTLSEVYYPHGWKAYIDGKETEIFKTNYILRGIQVPSGNHKVEFVFEPKEFTFGIYASSISFFGVMGILIFSLVVQQRNKIKTERAS